MRANQHIFKSGLSEYEGFNLENILSRYERIQEIPITSYTKNSVKGKEFPVLKNS